MNRFKLLITPLLFLSLTGFAGSESRSEVERTITSIISKYFASSFRYKKRIFILSSYKISFAMNGVIKVVEKKYSNPQKVSRTEIITMFNIKDIAVISLWGSRKAKIIRMDLEFRPQTRRIRSTSTTHNGSKIISNYSRNTSLLSFRINLNHGYDTGFKVSKWVMGLFRRLAILNGTKIDVAFPILVGTRTPGNIYCLPKKSTSSVTLKSSGSLKNEIENNYRGYSEKELIARIYRLRLLVKNGDKHATYLLSHLYEIDLLLDICGLAKSCIRGEENPRNHILRSIYISACRKEKTAQRNYWLNLAIRQNHPEALFSKAEIVAIKNNDKNFLSRDYKNISPKVLHWINRAAKAKHKLAMKILLIRKNAY